MYDKKSFKKIKYWIDEVFEYIKYYKKDDIKFMLIRNILKIEDKKREMSKENCKILVDSYQIDFYKTNIEAGEGANEAFYQLTKNILKNTSKPKEKNIIKEKKCNIY